MSAVQRRSTRWKDLERATANKLGGRRIVRLDFFESSPDVLVDDFDLIVECKAYAKFAHHTILEVAARKYARKREVVALATKHAGQHGEYITVPLDWLAGILDEVRAGRRGGAA